MPCREFDERLQQVLDDRNCPDADARLREIASIDETVAARLRAAELIASPPTPAFAPSADFADRILSRIREEDLAEARQRHAPIWRRRSFWFTGMGLATAALVLVAMSLPRAPTAPETITETSPAPPVVADKGVPAPAIETDDKMIDTLPTWEASKTALAGISKKLDVREEKVAQLQSGLNPLRSTFNVTLHVLRSTVPNRPPQSPPQTSPPGRPIEGKPSSSLFMTRWYV